MLRKCPLEISTTLGLLKPYFCFILLSIYRDAAHRVHPLAGQGVNLGFGDVVTLKDVICKAINNGSDPGSLLYLKEYQSKRQLHNLPVMAAIHGLHLLYGTTWTPLVTMRSIGLNIFDSLSSVKQIITQRASA